MWIKEFLDWFFVRSVPVSLIAIKLMKHVVLVPFVRRFVCTWAFLSDAWWHWIMPRTVLKASFLSPPSFIFPGMPLTKRLSSECYADDKHHGNQSTDHHSNSPHTIMATSPLITVATSLPITIATTSRTNHWPTIIATIPLMLKSFYPVLYN